MDAKPVKVFIGGFGGKQATASGKRREKQLGQIGQVLRLAGGQLGHSPATGPAILAGVVAYVLAEAARTGLRGSVEMASQVWWVPFLIAAIVGAIMVAKAPYHSWAAKLYDLLSAYDPADVAAYKRLQELARTHGLQRPDIEEWLAAEWAAVAPAPADGPRVRFFNKKL